MTKGELTSWEFSLTDRYKAMTKSYSYEMVLCAYLRHLTLELSALLIVVPGYRGEGA
jgi:hypothetical protein